MPIPIPNGCSPRERGFKSHFGQNGKKDKEACAAVNNNLSFELVGPRQQQAGMWRVQSLLRTTS